MNIDKNIEILLIDDNLGDADIIKEAFIELNFFANITIADNGDEAINYLKGGFINKPYPDLILLDINLPRKSGFEILTFIKKDEILKIIPVIILTNSEVEQDILNSYKNYANSYIIKPFDYEKFLEILSSIINFWFKSATLPFTKNLLVE